ncbi:hypothetical protein ACVWWN_008034 [Mycobacterium sp. URHB0021]|jgi:hypothetical protein
MEAIAARVGISAAALYRVERVTLLDRSRLRAPLPARQAPYPMKPPIDAARVRRALSPSHAIW